MPSSYQAPRRKEPKTSASHSQTTATNTATEMATVGKILENKGQVVYSIRPEATLHTAVEMLRDKGIGALLVLDSDTRLVGILSERDIVRKLADTPGETLPKLVSEIMTSRVETCQVSDPLISVLRRMTDGRFRHMPIVEGNMAIGMLTIGDVVNHRLTELEHEALQLKQLIVG